MLEVPGPPTASGPAADHPFAFHNRLAWPAGRIVKGPSRNCHFLVTCGLPSLARQWLAPSKDAAQSSLPFVTRTIRKGRRVIVPVHVLVSLGHVGGR